MSRSYWHTPIKAWCGKNCSKQWRSDQNRKYRAYVHNMMAHEKYDYIEPYKGRFGNEWNSPRDGKVWIGNMKYRKCPYYLACYDFRICCIKDRHHCYKYFEEEMRK